MTSSLAAPKTWILKSPLAQLKTSWRFAAATGQQHAPRLAFSRTLDVDREPPRLAGGEQIQRQSLGPRRSQEQRKSSVGIHRDRLRFLPEWHAAGFLAVNRQGHRLDRRGRLAVGRAERTGDAHERGTLVRVGDWPRAGAAETARTQTDKMDTRARSTRMEFSWGFAIIVSPSSVRSASPLWEERDDETEPAALRAAGRRLDPTA